MSLVDGGAAWAREQPMPRVLGPRSAALEGLNGVHLTCWDASPPQLAALLQLASCFPSWLDLLGASLGQVCQPAGGQYGD
jgi:hypothetical protein